MKFQWKKKYLLYAIPLLVIAVLLSVILLVNHINESKESKKPVNNTEENKQEILLLDFESYKEIVGTNLSMHRAFGRMSVNKDKTYITNGKGSMKVKVQGDYTEPEDDPWIAFECSGTTMTTSDFSDFQSVSLDVYNDTNEELHMSISVTVMTSVGGEATLPAISFSLPGGEWTTCTYELEVAYVMGIYDMSAVQEITLAFEEHKESKEDAPNTFYLDNLVGNYYETKPEVSPFNLYEGIGFEQEGQDWLFSLVKDAKNQQRVKYEEEGMEVPEELGAYGLRLDVPLKNDTNTLYPTVKLSAGEMISAGTTLRFKAYVKTSDSYTGQYTEVKTNTDAFQYTKLAVNQWVDVAITVMKDNSFAQFLFVLKNGNENVQIYLDDFVLIKDFVEKAEKNKTTYMLTPGIFNNAMMRIGNVTTNTKIKFDVEIDKTHKASLDAGKWYARFELMNGHTRIGVSDVKSTADLKGLELLAEKVSESAYIRVRLFEKDKDTWVDWYNSGVNFTLSNFNMGSVYKTLSGSKDFENEKGTEFQFAAIKDLNYLERVSYKSAGVKATTGLGAYGLHLRVPTGNEKTTLYPTIQISNGKKLAAGTTVKFKVYVKTNAAYTGQFTEVQCKSGACQFAQPALNQWIDVAVTVMKKSDSVPIVFVLKNGAKPVDIYIDNLVVQSDFVEKVQKDKTTYTLIPGVYNNSFMYVGNVKANTKAQFDVEIDDASKASLDAGKWYARFEIMDGRTRLGVTDVKRASELENVKLLAEKASESAYIRVRLFQKDNNAWKDWYNSGLKLVLTKYSSVVVNKTLSGSYDLESKDKKNCNFKIVKYANYLERVSYNAEGIQTTSNLGNYGLCLNAPAGATSGFWPELTFSNGSTIKAGTYLKFNVYIKAAGEYTALLKREAGGKSKVSDTLVLNQWAEVTVKVAEDMKEIPIVFTLRNGTGKVDIYLDNFQFLSGTLAGSSNLESTGEQNCTFSAANYVNYIDIVSYAEHGITADGLGTYGVYLNVPSKPNAGATSFWPEITFSNGKTIKEGTYLQFKAYIKTAADYVALVRKEAGGTNKASIEIALNQWVDVTVKVAEDMKEIPIMFTLRNGPGEVDIYLDNFRFLSGTLAGSSNLESTGEQNCTFSAVKYVNYIDRVSYAEEGIKADGLGTYGAYLNVPSKPNAGATSFWPEIKFSNGSTIKEGTYLQFKAYIKTAADYVALVRKEAGGTNKASIEIALNQWVDVTVKVAEDMKEIPLMFTLKDGTGEVDIYLDNFRFLSGTLAGSSNLESTGEQNCTFSAVRYVNYIDRVSYAEKGIQADGLGTYGAYLNVPSKPNAGSTSFWPEIKFSNGSTIKAGTYLQFKAYIKTAADYVALVRKEAGGTNKASIEIALNQWVDVTVKVAEDMKEIPLMFTLRNGPGEVDIYLDNFMFIQP